MCGKQACGMLCQCCRQRRMSHIHGVAAVRAGSRQASGGEEGSKGGGEGSEAIAARRQAGWRTAQIKLQCHAVGCAILPLVAAGKGRGRVRRWYTKINTQQRLRHCKAIKDKGRGAR